MHKKYIIKGGKRFGPYFYESYREDGKVKTRYVGRDSLKDCRKPASSGFSLFQVMAAAGMILIFLLLISGDGSASAVSEIASKISQITSEITGAAIDMASGSGTNPAAWMLGGIMALLSIAWIIELVILTRRRMGLSEGYWEKQIAFATENLQSHQ